MTIQVKNEGTQYVKWTDNTEKDCDDESLSEEPPEPEAG